MFEGELICPQCQGGTCTPPTPTPTPQVTPEYYLGEPYEFDSTYTRTIETCGISEMVFGAGNTEYDGARGGVIQIDYLTKNGITMNGRGGWGSSFVPGAIAVGQFREVFLDWEYGPALSLPLEHCFGPGCLELGYPTLRTEYIEVPAGTLRLIDLDLEQWTNGPNCAGTFRVAGVVRSIYYGIPPQDPTPTPTATQNTGYCQYVGTDPGDVGEVELPRIEIGPVLDGNCVKIGGFTVGWGWIGSFTQFMGLTAPEDLVIPRLKICYRMIRFGKLKMLNLEMDMDILAFVVAAIAAVRLLFRS